MRKQKSITRLKNIQYAQKYMIIRNNENKNEIKDKINMKYILKIKLHIT